MFRKYILPLVALAGVVFAIFTVIWGDKTRPPVPPVSDAAQSPYPSSVAGSGIVEASTENISIGTQIAGIVAKIFVEIGSNVKAGDPLFKIDDRSLLAELNIRQAAVRVAEAQLAGAQYDLALAESLSVERITTVEERDKARFAAQKAQAQLAQTKAELESIKRRTWRRNSQGLRITSIKRGCIKGWLASHPIKLPVSHRNRERAYPIITGNRTAMDCSNYPLLLDLEFAINRVGFALPFCSYVPQAAYDA